MRASFYLDQGNCRARSRYQVIRNLTRHFPWQTTIDKISHQDVAEAIAAIEGRSQAAHAFKEHSVLLQLVRSTPPQVIALRRTKRRYRRLALVIDRVPPILGAVRASDKYAGPCA